MLQNSRITAFTVFELLRENQLNWVGKITPTPTQIRVNLMSRTNETRHIEWREMRNCHCKFGANICINKQGWIKSKCRCECR